MTKAKKGPAKVSGAVLIMILAVMTVLIILLAGSIAVVYSTHQRVAVKYQESQAYYTMRSTLEACLNSLVMSKDKANTTTSMKVYYYEGGTDPIKMLSGGGTNPIQRGRYEELKLYQVPVSTETNSGSPNYNKWYDLNVTGGTITDVSQVNITDSDLSGAGITDSDFSNYKAQYAVPQWTSSMKVGVDDTVVYTIDMNSIAQMAVNDSGETITRMLDTGLNDTAIVKLQVLERVYDLGGSASDPIGKRFLLGERNKDYFRVKATCEINIDGEPQTYSIYYSTKKPVPKINGVSSLSKITPGSKLRMINEVNSLENTNYFFQNNSLTTGDVSLFGDFEANAGGSEFVIEAEQTLLVKGKLWIHDTDQHIVIAETGATIYCKDANICKPLRYYNSARGNFICSGTYETDYKDGSQDLSMFLNEYKFKNANPPSQILYTGTNYYNKVSIVVGNAGDIANWVAVDTSAMTLTTHQRLRYVLGNCVISDSINFIDWAGNLFASYPVTGDTTDNTRYKILRDGDTSQSNDTAVVTADRTKVVKVDYDTDALYDTSIYKKKITLPGALEGTTSNELLIKTQRSIFNERFEEVGTDGTATWNADGTFVSTDQTFLWNHLKSREMLPASSAAYASGTGVPGVAGGYVNVPVDPSNPPPAGTGVNVHFDSVITKDDGILELKGSYSGDICFDTREGDINVVFNDNVKGRFYVVGDNNLKIYLTSHDGTFDLGDSGYQFMLVDFNTINVSTGSINMLAGRPRGPKTTIYVCDDSSGDPLVETLTLYKLDSAGINNCGPVVCAQIDAPKTDFYTNSSGGKRINLTLPSGYSLSNVPVAIMGSMFTNSFHCSEDRAIWSMIPPTDPKEKQVNLYSRYR